MRIFKNIVILILCQSGFSKAIEMGGTLYSEEDFENLKNREHAHKEFQKHEYPSGQLRDPPSLETKISPTQNVEGFDCTK